MASGQTTGPARDPEGAAASASKRPARTATITELELAFAQDPQSDAYVPLCEAYLDQSRFMEAMVVCKKGIKAHPDSVEARVLLARVYSRQKKYPRAMSELDGLIAERADAALAFAVRGELRAETGDEKGAIDDWKRAIDLDPEVEGAQAALQERDIVYPEPEPEPEPPPPPALTPAYPGPAMPGVWPTGAPPIGTPTGPIPRVATAIPGAMPGAPGEGYGGEDGRPPFDPASDPNGLAAAWGSQPGNTLPPGMMYAPGQTLPPGASLPPGMYGYPARQRLEGEDELEALAATVAETTKERPGSPILTLGLVGICVLVGSIAIGVQVYNKRKVEAIDGLMGAANAAFREDTYGGYLQAASRLEQILGQHDEEHPLTLGMLAHTYAILWGEHGDSSRLQALDETLARAERFAPDVSHTAAARGLRLLYDGNDRQKAANATYDAVWPFVERIRAANGAPSFADLVLGLAQMEQGRYEQAVSTLTSVKAVLGGSVRAKVVLARAAFRAGDLSRAEREYTDALSSARDHSGARAQRALVRVQRGQLDAAAQDVDKFYEYAAKNPKDVSTRDAALVEYALSEVARAAGDEAKAQVAYERALRADPRNADFPYGLGAWMLRRGRARDALEPLKKALALEPGRQTFQIALAEAEMETGAVAEASKRLEQVLASNARSVPAAVVKARLLTKQGSPEAEKYIEDFIGWSSGHAAAHLAQARHLRQKGDKGAARKALETAIGLQRITKVDQAAVLFEYGDLTEELGEANTALNSYRQAATLGELEGWFRVARIQARDSGKEARTELAAACRQYLSAGSAMPSYEQARAVCP